MLLFFYKYNKTLTTLLRSQIFIKSLKFDHQLPQQFKTKLRSG